MARDFANGDGGEFQSPALERLVKSLSRLPGLGRKSATRLAVHLVGHDQAEGPAEELVAAVTEARLQVTNCSSCGAITEDDPCRICKSERRDSTQICIVATPVDILPFEKAGFFDEALKNGDDGDMWNANLGVNFQAWRHVGFDLSYQYFNLNVNVDKGSWRGGVDMTYSGPVISVTANW